MGGYHQISENGDCVVLFSTLLWFFHLWINSRVNICLALMVIPNVSVIPLHLKCPSPPVLSKITLLVLKVRVASHSVSTSPGWGDWKDSSGGHDGSQQQSQQPAASVERREWNPLWSAALTCKFLWVCEWGEKDFMRSCQEWGRATFHIQVSGLFFWVLIFKSKFCLKCQRKMWKSSQLS